MDDALATRLATDKAGRVAKAEAAKVAAEVADRVSIASAERALAAIPPMVEETVAEAVKAIPRIKGDPGPPGQAIRGERGRDGIGPDEKVKLDAQDPTAGFLEDKLQPGLNIAFRRSKNGEALVIDANLGRRGALPAPGGAGSSGGGSGTPSSTVTAETTFGISPAAGVATAYSRGDHTHGSPATPEGAGVPATTVESETTFGIAAAVGTDTEYARQDHTHGSPTAPTAASLGAAPDSADYLVGTASGALSGEIVAGTTPGGELGGTWASPTVDATHSGSTHAATQAAAEATAASALSTHTGLSVMDGDAAGGDLGGTYPNPSVSDDSHSHTAATLPALSDAVPIIESGSGTAGIGTTASRDDHVHPEFESIGLSAATPLAEASAGDAGVGTGASRYDHVHPAGGLALALGAGNDGAGQDILDVRNIVNDGATDSGGLLVKATYAPQIADLNLVTDGEGTATATLRVTDGTDTTQVVLNPTTLTVLINDDQGSTGQALVSDGAGHTVWGDGAGGHVADTTDAHDASAISYDDAVTEIGNTVQLAIDALAGQLSTVGQASRYLGIVKWGVR